MTIFRFMAMNFPQFTIRMDSILLILDESYSGIPCL